jgi:hypothetical protein
MFLVLKNQVYNKNRFQLGIIYLLLCFLSQVQYGDLTTALFDTGANTPYVPSSQANSIQNPNQNGLAKTCWSPGKDMARYYYCISRI